MTSCVFFITQSVYMNEKGLKSTSSLRSTANKNLCVRLQHAERGGTNTTLFQARLYVAGNVLMAAITCWFLQEFSLVGLVQTSPGFEHRAAILKTGNNTKGDETKGAKYLKRCKRIVLIAVVCFLCVCDYFFFSILCFYMLHDLTPPHLHPHPHLEKTVTRMNF